MSTNDGETGAISHLSEDTSFKEDGGAFMAKFI